MISNLPAPIASYISAANQGDSATVADYFTGDAVMRDEAQTHEGLAAIAHWMAETMRKLSAHDGAARLHSERRQDHRH